MPELCLLSVARRGAGILPPASHETVCISKPQVTSGLAVSSVPNLNTTQSLCQPFWTPQITSLHVEKWLYILTFSVIFLSQSLLMEKLSLFCWGYSVSFTSCLIQDFFLWEKILSKLFFWHCGCFLLLVWHSWGSVTVSANYGWILLLRLSFNPPILTIIWRRVIILTNLNGHSRCPFIVEWPTNHHITNGHKNILTICDDVWVLYTTPDI